MIEKYSDNQSYVTLYCEIIELNNNNVIIKCEELSDYISYEDELCDYYGMRFQTGTGKTRVLSFHTHGHKVAKGIKSIGEWHWQLQKWNPMGNKTAGTIARWIWWSLTRM